MLIKSLENYLSEELPGLAAHKFMAPKIGGEDFRNFQPEIDFRESAVMLLLTGSTLNPDILFTLRSGKLNSHSGQISFPGGMKEEDENIIETAIRETYEEIGLIIDEKDILGSLSELYVPPSRSLIYPFVAYIEYLPDLKINHDEVEEVFFINLNHFLEGSNLKYEVWKFNGKQVDVPLWKIHSKAPLWGATSMILNELLEVIRKIKG